MKSNIPSPIKTYLGKRCSNKWLNQNVEGSYKAVVVVPAIKEFENIPKLLNSLSQCSVESKQESLILFSVNNSDECSDDIIENNRRTIDFLSAISQKENQYGLQIDFINAFSEGRELPSKDGGVGLARKIGMDQSLLYFNYKLSNNFIVCLDADCEVEQNYLSEIVKIADDGIKAGVIKYAHNPDNEAIVNYEIFLRYYVLGLKLAKSPYAYHSIGSCIIIDPLTYVKIGGMNKKKAGEDFYFLEKAAKQVPINSIDKTTVFPSSRKSWRVPFGTGQRINRFYEKVKDEYVLYDPYSFVILKNFLKSYFDSEKHSPSLLLKIAEEISPSLKRFLITNDFETSMGKIHDNSKSSEQLNYQKKLWFDSFRTLKLIHHLRDNGFPEKAMFPALNEIFDLYGFNDFNRHSSHKLPSFNMQVEYLSLLRKLT